MIFFFDDKFISTQKRFAYKKNNYSRDPQSKELKSKG